MVSTPFRDPRSCWALDGTAAGRAGCAVGRERVYLCLPQRLQARLGLLPGASVSGLAHHNERFSEFKAKSKSKLNRRGLILESWNNRVLFLHLQTAPTGAEMQVAPWGHQESARPEGSRDLAPTQGPRRGRPSAWLARRSERGGPLQSRAAGQGSAWTRGRDPARPPAPRGARPAAGVVAAVPCPAPGTEGVLAAGRLCARGPAGRGRDPELSAQRPGPGPAPSAGPGGCACSRGASPPASAPVFSRAPGSRPGGRGRDPATADCPSRLNSGHRPSLVGRLARARARLPQPRALFL